MYKLTWFAVWWDGDKPPHHPWWLLHWRCATHPFIVLSGGGHQFAHQDPLQTSIVNTFPQPSTAGKSVQWTQLVNHLKTMWLGKYGNHFSSVQTLTCRCVQWFHCGPQHTLPATLHTGLCYHGPSVQWWVCQGFDTGGEKERCWCLTSKPIPDKKHNPKYV